MRWRRVKKALGTLLGAATAAVVVAMLNAFGVDISLELAGAIATILTTLGTYLAPKNEEDAEQAEDEDDAEQTVDEDETLTAQDRP